MPRRATSTSSPPRVALVHDWLVAQRGGENVLLELVRLFPQAEIFTLVHLAGRAAQEIDARPIHTSFIQHLPGAPRRFRQYLPLFPTAIERFDLSSFDLVISSSHCVAKGVRTRPGQPHLAYIHTPMRYIWDQLPSYVPDLPARGALTAAARLATVPLRRWDVASSARPTRLVANSAFVAARIAEVWGRAAEVIHPPVDVAAFAAPPSPTDAAPPRQGLLVVSALVPYKRVDLAVDWATARGVALTVIGDGSELPRLRARAGSNVRFVGPQSPTGLRDAYRSHRALLFCGVEDFGIVPVEAIAAGCPVIALGQGGALETVDADTGVFFAEPTVEALGAAVETFEARAAAGAFVPSVMAARVEGFSAAAFGAKIEAAVAQLLR